MPDEFSIQISGIEETCAMLTMAPAHIAKAAYARALTAACQPVVVALRVNTPIVTGDLLKHLMTDVALDADGRGGVAQVGYGKLGYIARFVEYGHRQIAHGHSHKAIDAPVAANPFMRLSAAQSLDAALEAAVNSLKESFAEGIPGIPAAKAA
jgi:hypothetical protein